MTQFSTVDINDTHFTIPSPPAFTIPPISTLSINAGLTGYFAPFLIVLAVLAAPVALVIAVIVGTVVFCRRGQSRKAWLERQAEIDRWGGWLDH